jgi:hypothetical protein
MLTNQEIITTVKDAFLPLSCVAEIWDYDLKLKFRISDTNNGVVRMDEVALHLVQDKEILETIVQRVRARIQDKGYVLLN